MTDVPPTNLAAEPAAEMLVSRPEGGPPASQAQPPTERERCQGILDALDQEVREIDVELPQLSTRMVSADHKQMEGLRARGTQLRRRRETLVAERPLWVRRLDVIGREEQVAAIELHLTARRNAQHEGGAIADKLREALKVVDALYQQWSQWSEADRKLKDMIRSLDASRMTDAPDFGWITSVDQNFAGALNLVTAECRRSESALKTRAHGT
jgi:hypothetical protein